MAPQEQGFQGYGPDGNPIFPHFRPGGRFIGYSNLPQPQGG
jgi:hypothetical protein